MHNVDLPLPNIYFATVESAVTGQTIHTYIAADFVGAAIAKVGNLCADRHGFRPYRSTATVKLRRLKLQDYLDNPDALRLATFNAAVLGERETCLRLQHRPRQVNEALIKVGAKVDHDAVDAALGEALRQAVAL